MSTKRFRYIACNVFIICVLISCSKNPFPDSLQLETASASYTANPAVYHFITLTRNVLRFTQESYGIEIKEKDFRFLPGSREALAWRLVAVPRQSLSPVTERIYYEKAAAEQEAQKRQLSGHNVWLGPENPLYINKKPAPFLEVWSQWNYERQVERVFQVVFYHYLSHTLKRSDSEYLTRFLAEKATEEYLLRTLGGASPVLSRYISEQRDEKTFNSLYPDFAERVYNLYANRDPATSPEDLENNRNQLLKVWIAEFKKYYADRFLTNRYASFGNTIPDDAEIAAWKDQLGNWKQYQTEFKKAGESVASYLKMLQQ